MVILATSRPMHSATKDDQKSKLQIFQFYDFTKVRTDIVDQLRDYYSTQAKLLGGSWWHYMLDTAYVNVKTICCLKEGLDVHCLNRYDFG